MMRNKLPKYEVRAVIPRMDDPDIHIHHFLGEYPLFQQDYEPGLSQEHVLEKGVLAIFKKRIAYDKQLARHTLQGRDRIVWESHLQTEAISKNEELPDEYGWYKINREKGPFDMELPGEWIVLPTYLRKLRKMDK